MEVSKYNAEGYYDPTAYQAIRNAEKLRIIYPTGYIELNLNYFFPCPLNKARKVFSLIHQYSSEADKDRLLNFLYGLERGYAVQMQDYADKAIAYPKKSYEYRKYISRFKEARRLRQISARNIELFTAGRDSR